MPRATNKQELMKATKDDYQTLLQLINRFSAPQRLPTFSFEDRDRNVRDVICHLYEWHLMFMDWHKVGMAGQKPIMPKQGYTWKTLPALNKLIWEKYQTMDLDTALKHLTDSHQTMVNLMQQYTNEELFTKKHYKWTGTTHLASYLISSCPSHYQWAIKKINKHLKSLA